MKLKHLLKSKTVKNAGWLIGGRVVQMLINFVVGILAARYLAPSNYGLIGYAGAYTAFFASLCNLGINSVIVKEFVDRPDRDGEIIGTALGLRAISSLLSAGMILAIVSFADKGESLTILVVALCNVGLFFQIFETFRYWFQARLESKVSAVATLVAYLVTAAYKLSLMASGKSVVYFAFATSVDYICVGLFLSAAYRRHGGGKLSFSWNYGKRLLSKSCYYILPALMVAVYGQTDKLMLKQMIDVAEVGYYNTAVSICSAWCFVLSAIIDSMYPTIMEAHRDGHFERYAYSNKLLYAIVFYVSLFVSCCFLLLAKPLIFFLYGEAYLPAVAPLRIITWYTAFSYLGVARNAWIVCENKQKYLIWVYLSAAVSNVILNLIMIPAWGTVGAALASLAAQFITTMVTPFLLPSLRYNAVMMLSAIGLQGLRIKRKEES